MYKKFVILLILSCWFAQAQIVQKTDLLNISYQHIGNIWHSLNVESPIGEAHAGLLLIPDSRFTDPYARVDLNARIGTRDCFLDCDVYAWLKGGASLSGGTGGGCDFHCGYLTIHWYEAFYLLVAEDQLKFRYEGGGHIDSANVKRISIGCNAELGCEGCLVREDSRSRQPMARAEFGTKIILLEDGRSHPGWFKVVVNIDGVWVRGVIARRLLELSSGEKVSEDFKYQNNWLWDELEKGGRYE